MLDRQYLQRQAAMLVRFAKSTHDPNLAAALLDKAVDLKAKVDESGMTNPTPDEGLEAPRVDPQTGAH